VKAGRAHEYVPLREPEALGRRSAGLEFRHLFRNHKQQKYDVKGLSATPCSVFLNPAALVRPCLMTLLQALIPPLPRTSFASLAPHCCLVLRVMAAGRPRPLKWRCTVRPSAAPLNGNNPFSGLVWPQAGPCKAPLVLAKSAMTVTHDALREKQRQLTLRWRAASRPLPGRGCGAVASLRDAEQRPACKHSCAAQVASRDF